MKRFTINMTLAVAALTLAAGTVSAQTMKAEIPFAFRVGGQVMQPGSYRVSILSGTSSTRIVRLTGDNVVRTTLASETSYSDVPSAWTVEASPKLRFACDDGPCTLTSLFVGTGSPLEFRSGRCQERRAAHRRSHAPPRALGRLILFPCPAPHDKKQAPDCSGALLSFFTSAIGTRS